MIDSAQITVTTTATLLSSGVDTREFGIIAVTNRGSGAIFLGNANVTAATGFQVDAGQTLSADVSTSNGEMMYGITASGSQLAHVIRIGR